MSCCGGVTWAWMPTRPGEALGPRRLRLLTSILSRVQFQWRLSREDVHSRQMRKSKGKLSARGKRRAEENDRNLEDPFPKAGDVGNCVPSQQPEDGASEEEKGPVQEVTGEPLCPDGRLCVEGGAVQNGPAGHCGASAGGCEGPSGPGEDAGEGGPEDVAAETAEDY